MKHPEEGATPVPGGFVHGEDLGEVALTAPLRSQLLDPESWNEVLALYARTTHLAVALIDADGRLIGVCHNPQPIWQLARTAKPNSAGNCLFCLENQPLCSAAAGAARTNSPTLACDPAGFAHVALPLTLGNQHLGTLLAGQVLDRYPQVLPLRRLAREFGLSPQRLWDLSRQRAPMSRAHLTVFGELLWTLGQALLGERYETTLRKRSESLLRQANTNLQHFSYAASHDLQEPLRAVMTSMQLLARENVGKLDAEANRFVADAVEGARRIEIMLRELREYWLVTDRPEQKTPVDSLQVLLKTLRGLQVSLEESGAIVTHDPLPALFAAEVSLATLFQNLVGNAIKYRRTGVPPAVHISARKEGDGWCFSVKDNGIGIEAQHLKEVFAPFKRLHGKEYPGSGIGLALCSKIIELHGGRIWAESVYGQGSTFFFTLPAGSPSA